MPLIIKEIEAIIDNEITVDCYDEHEVNMGWTIYMTESLEYPFKADYIARKKGGITERKTVKVIENETTESSFNGYTFYVNIELEDLIIPVNLDELRNIKASQETLNVIQIWKYKNNY